MTQHMGNNNIFEMCHSSYFHATRRGERPAPGKRRRTPTRLHMPQTTQKHTIAEHKSHVLKHHDSVKSTLSYIELPSSTLSVVRRNHYNAKSAKLPFPSFQCKGHVTASSPRPVFVFVSRRHRYLSSSDVKKASHPPASLPALSAVPTGSSVLPFPQHVPPAALSAPSHSIS